MILYIQVFFLQVKSQLWIESILKNSVVPPPPHTHTRFHILKKPFTWETMAEQDVIAYPAGKKKKHGLFFMFYKFLTL